MNIIPLASSSAGNCYVIYNGSSYLLLEAGLKYKDLIKELAKHKLKLSDFQYCLVSHSHKDHSVAANDLSRFMTIVASEPTLKGVTGKRLEIRPKKWIKLGEYQVLGFETEHDCDGSLGFIIKSNDELLLFLTDAKYIIYNLKSFKFKYVMIECNYIDEIIEKVDLHPALEKRLINSHMSLRTCIKTLKSLDLSLCKGIYLIHLSDRHANEEKMSKEVMKATGIATYICGKYGGVK